MASELRVLPVDTADLGLVPTIPLMRGGPIDTGVQPLRLGLGDRHVACGLKLLALMFLLLGRDRADLMNQTLNGGIGDRFAKQLFDLVGAFGETVIDG